jgi:hypothetical protein
VERRRPQAKGLGCGLTLEDVSNIQLTLIGKPGCHLCDDARAAIERVTEGLPDASRIAFEERSILEEPELFDRYADEIPVVLIDGRQHTYWRVDKDRLAAALNERLAG